MPLFSIALSLFHLPYFSRPCADLFNNSTGRPLLSLFLLNTSNSTHTYCFGFYRCLYFAHRLGSRVEHTRSPHFPYPDFLYFYFLVSLLVLTSILLAVFCYQVVSGETDRLFSTPLTFALFYPLMGLRDPL